MFQSPDYCILAEVLLSADGPKNYSLLSFRTWFSPLLLDQASPDHLTGNPGSLCVTWVNIENMWAKFRSGNLLENKNENARLFFKQCEALLLLIILVTRRSEFSAILIFDSS